MLLVYLLKCLIFSSCYSTVLRFSPHLNETPVHWALIVAGSNGWDNYRHQADACHSYQIMKKHGLDEEHIILMMFNDIVNNTENPTKGVIINHPNGPNVYAGVQVDYQGKDVTPENFIAILQGDQEKMKHIGSGKVINSKSIDHIFLNFVDHGATGLIAFPDSELYAKDLMDTIEKMHKDKKYNEMLVYIEACESGSMFEGLLPNNISVYATTAANSEESSYACYYDEERQTYLGDVYSVKWMEDSDKENLDMETIHKQFLIIRKETNTSHVMQFGDSKIARESVSSFQASHEYFHPDPIFLPKVSLNEMKSEDVPLSILYHKLNHLNDAYETQIVKNKIEQFIKKRYLIEEMMSDIVLMATKDKYHFKKIMHDRHAQQLTQHFCYKTSVQHYDALCTDISNDGYARKSLKKLSNLCEDYVPVETILNSIKTICHTFIQ